MTATKYLVLCALVACGPSSRNGSGDDDGTTVDSGTIDPTGDGGGGDNCSAAAKLIYVVDQGNALYSFQPETKAFTKIGDLSCPTTGIDPNTLGDPTPFSMGVDRNATAWVLYSDGEVFNVDTTTTACTKTSYHGTNLTEFGMGFSTDAVGGDTDTLFIAGGTSADAAQAQLASFNTSTMATTNIAKVTGQPELTGNSNAELWGFFPSDVNGTTTPRVEQINKSTGAAVKTYSLGSLKGAPSAWAFAFYGGDYWVFLAKDLATTTTVYQVDGASGTIKSTTPTSRLIVGAGVSTCAPVVIF